jgi:guanidinoacetate N-methyltransferase
MEDWEIGYMSKLASIATKNGGRVLEVGYGLGLSASEIQKHNIEHHVIIECHPDVIKRSMDDLRDPISEQRVNVLQGFWEDITPLLKDESFDGILFDTYPLTEEEIHGNHFWFFEEAFRLLKKGGVLTYYSDEVSSLPESHCQKLMGAGFAKDGVEIEVVKVNPPEDCEYWQHDTIVAPKITKL